MKRTVSVLAMLFFCAASAFADDLPKIAVYVTGDVPDNYKKALGTRMLASLVNSKRYKGIERSNSFLAELEKEQVRQRSGEIDDSQISQLGKQFGVKFVCIADITPAFGEFQVSARTVNVETAEVDFIGEAFSKLQTPNDLSSVSDKVVENMFSGKTSSAQTVQQTKPVQSTQGAASFGFRDAKTGIEMIFVQGGTFIMGCTAEQGLDCGSNESPAHSVTLGGFYIGKHEITQKLWVQVMGANPSINKGENLPVENVSWDNIQKFISTLNAMTGKRYRLPTEAEWEYAARGGNKSGGNKYSGNHIVDDVAWYIGNSGGKTHYTGAKQPNELGIYDMTGNVSEWVNDWYGKYNPYSEVNPQGPNTGSYRVFRGGSWSYDARNCRVSFRYSDYPNRSFGYLGFRLAVSP